MSFGQNTQKYWVFFKERALTHEANVSLQTLKNRRMLGLEEIQVSDYGPKTLEKTHIQTKGIKIVNVSRWFNAISVLANNQQLAWLKSQSYVAGIRQITQSSFLTSLKIDNFSLPFSLVQIHSEAFFNKGYFGDSISIGLIDGGYFNANKDPALLHLFENNQVKAIRSFADPDKKDLFSDKDLASDYHGTEVLKHVAGLDYNRKLFYGLAIKSNIYLASTETSRSESRVEEDNWVAAIEWMDSLGVRLVNSSLGYSQGFSNPVENYTPQNMDGNTSIIAKGAQMAVNEKGMIVVVSAGNEGENKNWGGLISTPADVEGVISVAANDPNGLKMGYSSIGPSFLKYNKPDISVFSQYGTSFASPVVTGFIAAMIQYDPYMKSETVKEKLNGSGSLFPYSNNYLGFGFPNAESILANKNDKTSETVKVKKRFKLKGIPDKSAVIFDKKNRTLVSENRIVEIKDGQISINKKAGVKFSTIVLENKIIEIIWK